jgi:hypothetical protein
MVRLMTRQLLAAIACLSITAAQDEPLLNASFYDYIIVGGGTSGLTVANRLTENGKSISPTHTQLNLFQLTPQGLFLLLNTAIWMTTQQSSYP